MDSLYLRFSHVYSLQEAPALEGLLEELNKPHFSHISERVSRAEMELETHQTAFHYDKDNLQHLALDATSTEAFLSQIC